jgi:hypothetical protein
MVAESGVRDQPVEMGRERRRMEWRSFSTSRFAGRDLAQSSSPSTGTGSFKALKPRSIDSASVSNGTPNI